MAAEATTWIPALPEPLYVRRLLAWPPLGLRCRCACGWTLRNRAAYRLHWYWFHSAPLWPSPRGTTTSGVTMAELGELAGDLAAYGEARDWYGREGSAARAWNASSR